MITNTITNSVTQFLKILLRMCAHLNYRPGRYLRKHTAITDYLICNCLPILPILLESLEEQIVLRSAPSS